MAIDLDSAKYGDLQKECKTRGLSAKGKRTELVERLSAALAEEKQRQQPAAGKAGASRAPAARAAATSPPKAHDAAAKAAADAPKSTAKPVATRLADLKEAGATPLPARKAAPRTVSPVKSTRAAKPAAPAAPPKSSGAGCHCPISSHAMRWLLTAVLLALLGLGAVQYTGVYKDEVAAAHAAAERWVVQGVAWVDDATGGATKDARVALAAHAAAAADFAAEHTADARREAAAAWEWLHHRACSNWDVVQRQVRAAWLDGSYHVEQLAAKLQAQLQSRIEQLSEEAGCAEQMGPAIFQGVLPDVEGWHAAASTISFVGEGGDAAGPTKGTAILLVASSREQAARGAGALRDKLTGRCGAKCTEVIKGKELAHAHADARGELQERLARFLQACPSGAVLVTNVERVAPELLPVLLNALSEQGHFELDGAQVPTSRAVYWFTTVVPPTLYNDAGSDSFARDVKARLADRWSKSVMGEVVEEDPQTAAARAFRRRIDHVLPLAQAE